MTTGSGGPGGSGSANSITGSSVTRAGGGAGGNGQGGGGGSGGTHGSGGSGIVVIRVPGPTAPGDLAVAPGTNTLSTDPGGDQIATFTVTGTLTI
jgi:hypothetical protein